MTHTPDDAVSILAREGLDHDDVAILIGQIVEISGEEITDEDMDAVRIAYAADAADDEAEEYMAVVGIETPRYSADAWDVYRRPGVILAEIHPDDVTQPDLRAALDDKACRDDRAWRVEIQSAAHTAEAVYVVGEIPGHGRFGIAWGSGVIWGECPAEEAAYEVSQAATAAGEREAAHRGSWLGAPDDVVGVAEIALRAGVAEATVHSWRRRHADFPEPLVRLAAGPVWDWREVDDWRAGLRNGRPRRG